MYMFINNFLTQLTLFEDVDPDRVFISDSILL